MKEKRMEIKLTELQEKYLEAIEWLINYDAYLGEGRSFLLAVAFINRALVRPGFWVRVFDHFPHRMATERLFETVKHLVKDSYNQYTWQFKRASFRLLNNQSKNDGHE